MTTLLRPPEAVLDNQFRKTLDKLNSIIRNTNLLNFWGRGQGFLFRR